MYTVVQRAGFCTPISPSSGGAEFSGVWLTLLDFPSPKLPFNVTQNQNKKSYSK